jgi:hypothetical protein
VVWSPDPPDVPLSVIRRLAKRTRLDLTQLVKPGRLSLHELGREVMVRFLMSRGPDRDRVVFQRALAWMGLWARHSRALGRDTSFGLFAAFQAVLGSAPPEAPHADAGPDGHLLIPWGGADVHVHLHLPHSIKTIAAAVSVCIPPPPRPAGVSTQRSRGWQTPGDFSKPLLSNVYGRRPGSDSTHACAVSASVCIR